MPPRSDKREVACGTRTCTILRAFFTRSCLAVFILICSVTAKQFYNDVHFYGLLAGLAPLCIEIVISLCTKKGREFKMYCPMIVCFLIGSIPSLILLDLDLLEHRIQLKEAEYNQSLIKNGFALPTTTTTTVAGLGASSMTQSTPEAIRVKENWINSLKQAQLLLIIVCRIFTFKSGYFWKEYPQHLTRFVAAVFDVAEIFDTLRDNLVKFDRMTTYAGLGLGAASLFQFGLIPLRSEGEEASDALWGIFSSLFLMDGPLLGFRLYLVISNRSIGQTMIFYIIKNCFLVTLDIASIVSRIRHIQTKSAPREVIALNFRRGK